MQTMGIDELEEPLVRCTAGSRHDVLRLEKAARSDPANLPPVRVGVVDGRCYPMGGLDILEACNLASVHEIRMDARRYESKLDLMIDQIKGVSAGEHIDPLRIRGIIDELGALGMSADEAIQGINLQGTSLEKVVKCDITDEALGVFAEFIETKLSGKLRAELLVVPTHILLRIARLDPVAQTDMAERITEITIPESEMNFAWPAPDAIVYLIRNTPKPEVQAEPVIVGITRSGGSRPAKPGILGQVKHDALEDLSRTAKDCMIVTDDDGEPKFIVNKKDNTVREVSMGRCRKGVQAA